MHSVAVNVAINNDNRDTLLKNNVSPTRPNLSIDTNMKKKKWNTLFSAKDKTRFDVSPTKDSAKRSSLLTPPSGVQSAAVHSAVFTDSPPSSLRGSIEKLDSYTSTSSSEDQKSKSLDSSTSINSNNSAQSVFKKFHVPHFHKRTDSGHTPTIEESEECSYEPIAPEPIMPALINWSPEAPLSPPPWELQHQQSEPIYQHSKKRNSMGFDSIYSSNSMYDRPYDEAEEESITTLDSAAAVDYHSDSEIGNHSSSRNKLANLSSMNSIGRSSDVTLVNDCGSSTPPRTLLRRRSSCPTYDTLSLNSTSTSSSTTLVDNDIITITEQHTRYVVTFKKYTHPADKKSGFLGCQKAKNAAAEAAANGTVMQINNPIISTFCEESLRYLYIPNVFHPETREPVLEFSTIKPRKYELHRKTSWKREAKAMMTWHHTLEEYIRRPNKVELPILTSPDKIEKNNLTRRFILREFFLTEVNFWNQLYYSKIIFYDAISTALSKGSQFVKETDLDPFANLFDLMQFSAKLINLLRHFQLNEDRRHGSPIIPTGLDEDLNPHINCNKSHVGKTICGMAEDFVVFLRCAVDYKENRKILDNNENNKGYMKYKQKLSSRKETSQFEMKDFLIIPIQRVARYGLLLADLIKHTAPDNDDYENLLMAHNIVTSLAYAMNSVQKKRK